MDHLTSSVSAPTPTPVIGPASFNQLWARASALARTRQRHFLALALALTVLAGVTSAWQAAFGSTPVALVIVWFVISAVVQLVVNVTSLRLIVQPDGATSLGAALKMGWRLPLSFIWLGILMTLVVAGGWLLIYPGFVWGLSFTFVPWILVVEGLRGRNALVRARQLGLGDGWWVFANLFCLGLLISLVLAVAFGLLSVLITGAAYVVLPQLGSSGPKLAMSLIATFLIAYLVNPRVLGFVYAMYQDLCRRKDVVIKPLPKHKTYFTVAAIAAGVLIPIIVIAPIVLRAVVLKSRLNSNEYGAFNVSPDYFRGLVATTTSETVASPASGSVATTTPEAASEPVSELTTTGGKIPTKPEDLVPIFGVDDDGDGLETWDETLVFGTLHLLADSDDDGYSDSDELARGYDPRFGRGTKLTDESIKLFSQKAAAKGGLSELTLTTLKGTSLLEAITKK